MSLGKCEQVPRISQVNVKKKEKPIIQTVSRQTPMGVKRSPLMNKCGGFYT